MAISPTPAISGRCRSRRPASSSCRSRSGSPRGSSTRGARSGRGTARRSISPRTPRKRPITSRHTTTCSPSLPAAARSAAWSASTAGWGTCALSPDGRKFGFGGFANPQADRSFNQSDLFVVDVTPGAAPRNLATGLDADLLAGLAADQHPPSGGSPQPVVWSRDGRSIIAAVAERGRVNLQRFDVDDRQDHARHSGAIRRSSPTRRLRTARAWRW